MPAANRSTTTANTSRFGKSSPTENGSAALISGILIFRRPARKSELRVAVDRSSVVCGEAMNDFIRSRSHTRGITDNRLASDLGAKDQSIDQQHRGSAIA